MIKEIQALKPSKNGSPTLCSSAPLGRSLGSMRLVGTSQEGAIFYSLSIRQSNSPKQTPSILQV